MGKVYRTAMGAKRAQEREVEKAKFLEGIREAARGELINSVRKASFFDKLRFIWELFKAA